MTVAKGAEIAPAKGKLGVLLVGLGAVSTTFIAGVEAIKAGIAEPIGSLTQMGTIRLGKRTDNRVPLIKDFLPLANLKDRSFEEVAEARAAVEVQVIWLAAQRIGSNELARLAALVREQEGMLDDPVRFQISDREFHTTLYRACGNSLLLDVVSDFYDYALEVRRRALQRPGAIAHSVAEHRGIVEALKTGKPEAAVAAAQKHLEQVRKTTLEEMSH